MRNKLFSLFIGLLAGTSLYSQGIEFYHGTWEEALMKSKTEDKIIFVDAFTTWCGPCKNMAANTFPDPEVGKFFNQNFISMKIDMEKEMGLEFKKKYPVSAYPTLFFIDYDGEVVLKAVGAKKPADLVVLGHTVISKFDKSAKYEAAYAAGDRSYQLVYDYVSALNKAGKPSVKIANDYLAEQKDLTTPDNLKFILEAASQVDCQCFDLFEKYKPEIRKVVDDATIDAKVRQACNNTVKRAIEFVSPELVVLAADAMKRNLPAEADLFRSESEIKYSLAVHDLSRIEELVRYHAKKFLKNDAAALNQMAIDLDKYAEENGPCRTLAIELSEKAAKEKDTKAAYYMTYAKMVFKSGDKEQALKIVDEALHIYNDEASQDNQMLKTMKFKMENS